MRDRGEKWGQESSREIAQSLLEDLARGASIVKYRGAVSVLTGAPGDSLCFTKTALLLCGGKRNSGAGCDERIPQPR